MMIIRNNSNAFNIWRNWQAQNSAVSTAIRRISSGHRINSAADDAAGLSITERMKALLRANSAEQMCTENKISQYEAEEATLAQVHSMLNRMLELSTQSMNGTYTTVDRHNLDAEYQQLSDEINRILPSATSLFDENRNNSTEDKNAVVYQIDNIAGYLDALDGFLNKVNSAVQSKDFDMAKKLGIDLSDNLNNSQRIRIAVADFTTQNLEKFSGISPGSGVYSIAVSKDNVSISQNREYLSLKGTNLLSSESAGVACEKIKKAINSVSELRGSLGAMTNLMERTKSRLSEMEVNLMDSMSRILDTDMAKEMMNLVRGQMQTQVNSFLMAQANQQSDLVLKLLNYDLSK